MADKRKLQGEIDRCLKRVAEGVEQFDDIWQKVHNAANANQKEKYEADLKKEIKKLQRLRDQIKTWLTSNDIKDKRPLGENRKLIETRMERFKVVERETKTKAYSKEGLGQVSKIDPEQRKKEEVRQWLTSGIEKLDRQIDEFEAEIESLYAGSKKKKLDRDKNDRVEELQGWVERHKYHIKQLETVMRLLDNCSLDADKVRGIMDDLDYYVDSNQEPDFTEDEMIYDELDLEEAVAGIYSSTAVPIPVGAPPHGQGEEEVNSISSSPSASSQGPLSPKTPTTMKSTSQELFEERRRGKTTSVSSVDQNEVQVQPAVPLSPRKPTSTVKAILQNSVVVVPSAAQVAPSFSSEEPNSSSTSISNPHPPPHHSAKPNSLPPIKSTPSSSAPTPLSQPTSAPPSVTSPMPSLSSAATAGSVAASNGTQKTTTPKLALSPWGQSSNNSPVSAQSPHSTASPTTVVLAQPPLHTTQAMSFTSGVSPVMTGGGVTISTSHPHISTSSQPRPPALGSGHSLHSRSSSNSSISSTALSQDSSHQPHPHVATVTVPHSLTNSGPGHHPVGPGVSASSAYETSTATPATSSGSTPSAQAHSQGSAPSSSGSPRVTMETDHASMSVQLAPFSPGSSGQQHKQTGTPPVPPSPSLSSAQHWSTPVESSTSGVPHSPAPHFTSSAIATESSMFSSVGIMSWLPPATASSMLSMATSNEVSSSAALLPPQSSTTGFMALAVGVNTAAAAIPSPPSSPFSSSLIATPPPSSSSAFPHSSLLTMHTQAPLLTTSQSFPQSESPVVSLDSAHQSSTQLQELSTLKDMAAEAVASSALPSGHHDDKKESTTNTMIRPLLDHSLSAPRERLDTMASLSSSSRTDTQLQPLLGVTPLGPMQLSQEKLYQLKMLEASCKHVPQPADSERVRPYLQRTPCPTPSFHHQHPPSHFDTFDFFQRLSIETLFFIFYYMEGTKAQYMAARALKKLSWRFHTKYMMWFQRLEEPKAITDDYEMGTYIYFDFEKWSQRKKEGFTFEYRYLEDKDLP
ncbi:CCR4-NOT transcription complex subunit 3 [Geodia barretti]|uniref:CCR4-NOT transcription complex subunit 3 n=2 Tax=Geodia barretti TaxID=519541 RepID=A0AA35TL01_GEOBA|nr:CCR4-NOT transcription complex subunit 3 [Geodia barretti]